MSLEQALSENTAAIHKLIAVMQSGVLPAASAPAADTATGAAKRTRKNADKPETTTAGSSADSGTTGTSETSPSTSTAAAGPEVNDGKKVSVKLLAGDPEGTRYFHIAAHKTVAAIKPGEVIPSMPNLVEIGGDEYAALRAQYSPAVGNVTAGAEAAAASTPSATPASSPSPAASPAVDGPRLMEMCKALHARDGNDGLRKVLEKFKVGKVGEIVANTAIHAEAAAFLDSLLNPKAEAPAATVEVNLF